MKRFYYYLECEEQPKLFKILNKHVAEGLITYSKNETTGYITINNLELDDDDDLFTKLENLDLIEDYDRDYDDNLDDDYSDFYNEEDYE